MRRRKAFEQTEELNRRPENVLDVRLEREDRRPRARRRRRARRATLRATRAPPVACSLASPPNRPRVTACRSRSPPPTSRRAARARGSARGSRDRRAWLRRRARRGCDTPRARRSRFRRRRAARQATSTSSWLFETFVEQRPAELQRREPEALAGLDRALPFAAAELVREDAEPRPLRPREPRQHGSCEGQVARDELAGARRRLEHDPVVVADLVERSHALGEVDRPESRRAIADGHANVLEWTRRMSGPSARISVARVHPARDHVGEVEVAAERSRCDAPGERQDRVGGQRALVTEHDALRRRRFGTTRGKRPRRDRGRPRRAARRVRRTGRGSRRRLSSAAHSIARSTSRRARLGHRRIGVGDTAAVAVLAEHQARHVQPGRGPLAHERRQPIARTELLASDVELDAVEREPPRASNTRPRAQGSTTAFMTPTCTGALVPTRRRPRAAILLRPSGTRRA